MKKSPRQKLLDYMQKLFTKGFFDKFIFTKMTSFFEIEIFSNFARKRFKMEVMSQIRVFLLPLGHILQIYVGKYNSIHVAQIFRLEILFFIDWSIISKNHPFVSKRPKINHRATVFAEGIYSHNVFTCNQSLKSVYSGI